jgi:hypothetical protein
LPIWNTRKLNTTVGRDELRDSRGAEQYSSAEIIALQVRHHLAPNVAGTRVVDHWFESITNLDAVLPLAWSQQQQYASVALLRSNPERLVQVGGVVFFRFAVQRFHGYYGDLGSGLLFHLSAERFQPGTGIRVNHSCKIRDVPLRTDIGNLLRKRQ